MKYIKSALVAVLVIAMLASVIGCHKKDEVAVTIGDINFTSAYYMCALINADSEAKSKVQENLTDDEKKSTDIDYYSKKIEKKSFVKWVEDTAIDSLKDIAAYKSLCKKAKLKLDKSTESTAESYASYYWSNYGYSSYFEPNGVSEDTYKQYMKDAYYSNLYFEHIYSKDGEKEIGADDVKNAMYENFIVADKIEVSFSGKEDAEKTTLKTQFNAYLADLTSGTKTFEQVYKEYNNKTDENDSASTSEEKQPQDKYASVLGAKGTAYESEYYDTAKAMATNEVKLIEQDNDAGLVLLVKKDIQADEYYLDTLDLATRHLLKDDEYKDYIKTVVKDLSVDKNNYAIKQFKVKKIVEPKSNQQAS